MTDEIKIYLQDKEAGGRYFSTERESYVAEMTFTKAGKALMIIDHTSVPPVFKGIGIGLKFMELSVSYAQENNRKIVPLCPYAAAQFKKHPEWHYILNEPLE